MTYKDIIDVQRKRDVKEALPTSVKRGSHKRQKSTTGDQKRSRVEELGHG